MERVNGFVCGSGTGEKKVEKHWSKVVNDNTGLACGLLPLGKDLSPVLLFLS